MYKDKPILGKQLIFDDIKAVFEIYDRIEWLQFVGGELFLHPDMDEILEEAFKYDAQFDKLILMTNGTLVPKEKVLNVLEKHKGKIEVQISDYGKLSYKIGQLVKALDDKNVKYKIKSYHGDIQHYGGWMDCGGFEERGYTEEEIAYNFNHCSQIQMKNLHSYNGCLHNCIRSLFGADLGLVDMPKDEYVNLWDNQLTLEQKKEIARNFCTKPLYACRFCGGFDSENAKRYPAAEQI
ncbi:MAG: hypothetical protein M1308_17825 [Actinobacteria bacterium]|nr:hypothetical protein [Actinomycetota bacterium]